MSISMVIILKYFSKTFHCICLPQKGQALIYFNATRRWTIIPKILILYNLSKILKEYLILL